MALLGLLLSPPLAAIEDPQPLSPAERAAVELAALYLSEGPEAWVDRLAAESPLAAMEPGRAAAEIGVRAGPTDGASWELQTLLEAGEASVAGTALFAVQFPSGLDEALTLEMVEEAGQWRLADVRSWAERSSWDEAAVAASEVATAGAEVQEPAAVQKPRRKPLVTPLQRVLGPLIGLVLLIVAASVRRRSRWLAWLLLLAGFASILLSIFLPGPIDLDTPIPPPGSPEREGEETAEGPGAVEGDSLGSLLPLRRALAAAEPPPGLEQLWETVPEEGEAALAGRLWRAQHLLLAGDLPAAREGLSEVYSADGPALAKVLRGRLALLGGEEEEVVIAYERALEALPAYDGLLLEGADSLAGTSFQERAKKLYARLAAAGSRSPRAHYRLIDWAASRVDEEAALAHLRMGWRLEPAVRGTLLGDPVRSFLIRRHDLFSLLDLDNPLEPVPAAPPQVEHPLEIPGGFRALLAGETLELVAGRTQLRVPGGVQLAPAEVELEGALSRRRRDEERALADLASAGWRSQASLGQPGTRTMLVTAGMALARDNRWDELLAVTDRFAEGGELPPPPLGQLRAEALRWAGQPEQAARLLVGIAKSNVAEGRKNPYALFQLARLLTEIEEFGWAEKAVQTAESQMFEPPIRSMLPRIRMEKKLANAFEVHRSQHFSVRYPAGTNRFFVEQLTEVLEKEFTRLQRWIPHRPAEPVEVHLFPFREFFRIYAEGREVLGLFDGKVRVPLAEVNSLHPSVVMILTHELAHALISSATGDRAPAWFHEGLAQHLHMVSTQINPIPDYQSGGKLVAFPLLDSILDGQSDGQLVELAYDESAWVVHYLEQRHGRRSLHRFLDAYRRGLNTEEAVAEVTGMSLAAFDAAVWRWAVKPTAWATDVIRYDQ